jgi:hypothetical protein
MKRRFTEEQIIAVLREAEWNSGEGFVPASRSQHRNVL